MNFWDERSIKNFRKITRKNPFYGYFKQLIFKMRFQHRRESRGVVNFDQNSKKCRYKWSNVSIFTNSRIWPCWDWICTYFLDHVYFQMFYSRYSRWLPDYQILEECWHTGEWDQTNKPIRQLSSFYNWHFFDFLSKLRTSLSTKVVEISFWKLIGGNKPKKFSLSNFFRFVSRNFKPLCSSWKVEHSSQNFNFRL